MQYTWLGKGEHWINYSIRWQCSTHQEDEEETQIVSEEVLKIPLDARCDCDDTRRQPELLEQEELGDPRAEALSQLGEHSQRRPRPLAIAVRRNISAAHPVGPATNDEGW